MKLKIRERIELFKLLPTQGNFGTLKTVRKLREKLEFTEAEVAKYGIEVQEIQNPITGQAFINTRWNPEFAGVDTEVDILPLEVAFLAGLMQKLAAQEKLPDSLLDVAMELVPEQKG